MTFFYDLNKKLAGLVAPKEQINESTNTLAERATGDYSAKKARAGKDIGKPGKAFGKIAADAAKRYGSKERGEKVAGAVLKKLRAKEAIDPSLEEGMVGDLVSRGKEAYNWYKANAADTKSERLKQQMRAGKAPADAQQQITKHDAQFRTHADKAMANLYNRTGSTMGDTNTTRAWDAENIARLKQQGLIKEMDDEMEEGNEFSGELAKAKASGAKSFKVDGKEYPVKEDFGPLEEKGAKKSKPDFLDLDKDGNRKESMKKAVADKKKNAFDPEVARSMFAPEKGKTKTGHEVKDTGYSKRYTKSLKDEPEDSDDDDTPKTKGRKTVGAGKGKKIGAKVKGTSKLHSKGAIAEDDDISLLDKGEYDQEGDMAKDDLQSIAMAAKELHGILGDDQNLPEWVQSKITKALDYINASNQYMHQQEFGREPVAEKAVSQQQQKFMGMAHAIQKGEKIKGASPELKKVAKTMKKSDVKDFAATKHEGLPKKVKEEGTADAPKSKKGGIQFGKGVYEAMNDNLESLITESMNVNVSMSTNDAGEPTKSITVSAEGEQAEMLAQLLNLAGLQGKSEACPSCGSTPCGCDQVDEAVDENNPDWPTDEETTGNDDPNLTRWAGGLNKPKETGQTTAPVVNRDPARGSVGPKEMAEATDLGLNLYAELKSFKAK